MIGESAGRSSRNPVGSGAKVRQARLEETPPKASSPVSKPFDVPSLSWKAWGLLGAWSAGWGATASVLVSLYR